LVIFRKPQKTEEAEKLTRCPYCPNDRKFLDIFRKPQKTEEAKKFIGCPYCPKDRNFVGYF
jgi:hypothetical protein